MASLVAAVDTEFTPAVGDFNISVTTMPATLMRKNSAGTAFAVVENLFSGAKICSNPVAGAVYKFTSPYNTAVVQADQ